MSGRWAFAAATLCLAAGLASAGEPPMPTTLKPPADAEPAVQLPVPVPTLGGGQFWGDVLLDAGYRVQHRVGTDDQYRLLSPSDVRLAYGSFEDCRRALSVVRERDDVPETTGEVVILIHGILRSSKSMARITRAFRESGVTPLPFDYPSTRVPIEESAGYLRRAIDNLPAGVTKVSFVVHSMGGLVVRTYLRGEPDPRLHRLVMIGVPNSGANLASIFKDVGLYRLFYGPAGQELIDGEAAPAAALPTPTFEFACIAGSRGSDNGFNPLVPGDDDGTVPVASARLKGACDFLAVRGLHSSLIMQANVADAAVRFVTTGCLHESGECDPVR